MLSFFFTQADTSAVDPADGFALTLPRAFFDDWVRVAEDEARHYGLWEARLRALGARYGDLPTHSGLWDSAAKTAHDLRARLAIEHVVLEGRGLDVVPKMLNKPVKKF